VERRLAEFRAFREQMERLSSPKARLLASWTPFRKTRSSLRVEDGPLSGLCTDLYKERGSLAKKSAALFTEPMGWIEEQFRIGGHKRIRENSPCISFRRSRVWPLWRAENANTGLQKASQILDRTRFAPPIGAGRLRKAETMHLIVRRIKTGRLTRLCNLRSTAPVPRKLGAVACLSARHVAGVSGQNQSKWSIPASRSP
jgi:hypothetical protein